MMTMKTGIDAHCHLEYMEDAEGVAKKVRETMAGAVCSVPDPKDYKKILELRKRFSDCISVCLGIHPESFFKYNEREIEDWVEFIKNHKKEIVGIGEIGLDYAWVKEKEKQEKTKEVFVKFINLADELRLPIVIHIRNGTEDAFADTFKILTNQNAKDVVLHCFSGNEQQLKYSLEQGYWIFYATIICKSDKHKRLAGKTPLESMLLETDAPWLDPESKELINRPWKIARSAEIIGKIHGKTIDEILKITEDNTKKIFRLEL